MHSVITAVKKLPNYAFLFQQLVKRDFEQKYKRTALGMLWSVVSPVLTSLVLWVVFLDLFGRNTPHFMTYLFCGNIVMSYYREATNNGMSSLLRNASIISKINVPKYLFLFSKNVSALINFGLTVLVFFIFCFFDHIRFTSKMILLIYPSLCLLILNIGVGMILSALYVFFRDISYLYSVFLMLLNYLSAIFYDVNRFPESKQKYFLLNPVYVLIKYFRLICIEGKIPSMQFHCLCILYPMIALLIGCVIYKKFNHEFIYYL